MSISYRGGFKFEPENDVSLEVFIKKDGRAKGDKYCTQSLIRMHIAQFTVVQLHKLQYYAQ